MGLSFRWLARRFPATQAPADSSPARRSRPPRGHTAYTLSVVVGGLVLAAVAALGPAALGQLLAERGDCTVACYGGSFIIWLIPWMFGGFAIVGLVAEALVRRRAPHLLESWRTYDEQRTGVDWRPLEKPIYIAIAVFALVFTLLGLRYSVRFGASQTEIHRFLVPGTLRLAHADMDSIVAYDCVRLRNGDCKPERGILITWRSGTRIGSGSNLYRWRPADAESLARALAGRTGAGLRIRGARPRPPR